MYEECRREGILRRGRWVALFLLGLVSLPASASVIRRDSYVKASSGVRLFVRELRLSDAKASVPILLLHGARVPGLASFDLNVPGGSFAADLAAKGFDVFVMDVRGYGRSTRPPEMNQPPEDGVPLVRAEVAVQDIAAVVAWIGAQQGGRKPILFGWAAGGQWAALYASTHPHALGGLVLLNSLYGGSAEHPLMGHGTDNEDPKASGRFNLTSCGAYRLNDAPSLTRAWDRSIPVDDKAQWRDDDVEHSYVEAALASDPTSRTRTPPSFRSPCGALEDSFYAAIGQKLWDASKIDVPTLILRSDRDFWSRPADQSVLAADLTHAPKVRVVVLKDATHFAHLDRPEHGRDQLLREIQQFAQR